MKSNVRWTTSDDKRANQEGWGICFTGGTYQIVSHGDREFPQDDAGAAEWISNQADKGSSFHRKALIYTRELSILASNWSLSDEKRRKEILKLARKSHEKAGELEFEDDAKAAQAEGARGAYVQAWVWVDFAGTKLREGGG